MRGLQGLGSDVAETPTADALRGGFFTRLRVADRLFLSGV